MIGLRDGLEAALIVSITAAFLVLIAAGLLASAAHIAHETSWVNSFQHQALNLSWLVVPGTMTSSLLWPQRSSRRPKPLGEAAQA